MKALEDLAIQYNGTVRQSSGGVVKFTYGDDSFDPIKLRSCFETSLKKRIRFLDY